MNTQKNEEILKELKKLNKLVALILVKKDIKLTNDEKAEMLNAVGFNQTEIGKFIGIKQPAVSKSLKKVKVKTASCKQKPKKGKSK